MSDPIDRIDPILARAESAAPAKSMLIGGSYDCPRCGARHPVGPCSNFERTQAKHPDTVRLDWLEERKEMVLCCTHSERRASTCDKIASAFVEVFDGFAVRDLDPQPTIRAAIDAARKALAESATPLPMREDPRYRGTDFRSAIDVDRASQGGGK